MCGVVALLGHLRGSDASRETRAEAIGRALDALAHRGPDGRGTYHDGHAALSLGHVRLAVTAPDDGAQPIASEDGRVVAVVNGELYEHRRVRGELEARGHRFRTRSDAEILVHLWEDQGERCLPSLRGEFAFVLWDARVRTLFAARDRFGIKPVVWHEDRGAFALASEAKALFALGVAPGWDESSLLQALRLQYPLVERTLFRGVRSLSPGTLLSIVDGRASLRAFADVDFPPPEAQDLRDPREAVQALGDALDEATSIRAQADAPVCVQLSGGIDSSVIASLTARAARAARAGAPPPCFTVSFDDAAYDELALARTTAAQLGADLHPLVLGRRALVDALPDAVAAGEGLAINGHLPAKFLLSRAMRDAGFKVVLTGEGADEVLAGYAHLRLDHFDHLARDPDAHARLAATNAASAGLMLPEGASLPLDAVRDALGFVPSWLQAKATLGHRVDALLADDARAEVDAYDAGRAFVESVPRAALEGRGNVDRALYLWMKSALAGYILRTLGDGMEMAHSIEGRVPFLDPRVFAVARRIPVELRMRDGVEKWPLREAARGLVPEAVRVREKHPFLAPPLGLASSELVRDLLHGGALRTLPFVDARKVLAALDALSALPPRARVALDPALVLITTALLLAARYGL